MSGYTLDKQKNANNISELEKSALDKWFKGDTSGYREIWSKNNFSYFTV